MRLALRKSCCNRDEAVLFDTVCIRGSYLNACKLKTSVQQTCKLVLSKTKPYITYMMPISLIYVLKVVFMP